MTVSEADLLRLLRLLLLRLLLLRLLLLRLLLLRLLLLRLLVRRLPESGNIQMLMTHPVVQLEKLRLPEALPRRKAAVQAMALAC